MISSSEATQPIVIIVDGSSSAAPYWAQIAQAATTLLISLPESAIVEVYLLGTAHRWQREEWTAEQPYPLVAQGSGSFVAPVLRDLAARRLTGRAIAIIGAGTVFDLSDWLGNGARWGLIKVTEDSLQFTGGRCWEGTSTELSTLTNLLVTAPLATPPQTAFQSFPFGELKCQLDVTGYPLIEVPPLGAYLSLFPVTKPQYEHFLATTHPMHWNDAWYGEVLALNPRPMSINGWDEYESVMLTGLLSTEAQSYCQWIDEKATLPTVRQWISAYEWLAQQPLAGLSWEIEQALAPTARRVWETIQRIVQPCSLLEFSLMRGGIIEWVQRAPDAYVGMGKPREKFRPGFHDVMKPYEPIVPLRRNKYFGFRVLVNRTDFNTEG